MERRLVEGDPARGWWRYRIHHGGHKFMQVVYAVADDRVSTYVCRVALKEHQGCQLEVLHALLKPDERQFANVDEAVNAGNKLILESGLMDGPAASEE